ncbi:hypothetical protein GCM10009007_02610 [Formosimonas limnophila]|uniref:Aconitate hydratase A n=2 Tax=Formosimonas limnophila TaxID=1384487 RepID=A0A8J3CJN0_9BURK|nr:hypothetical protein GCM10009007_02610 [Formosimonas limnophila]
MSHNLHHTLRSFTLPDGKTASFYSLPALESAGIGPISRLPISIRIVLESVLRHYDGQKITETHIKQLANWQATAERTDEIPFVVARVVLQDFTGVPLLADLAAMRNVAHQMGKNPKTIEPLVPVDLVVDHSVMVDKYGTNIALRQNMEREFERNGERYQFMKWGMQAFDTFKVVPPGIGIVHQVNLEYLFRGVNEKNGVYYPDTLVGTDSHTTMINGVGVVGWGVGGIEAEAAMLGQPVYFLTPDVVGVELSGALNEGVTATDLVLTITEMLRREKVVGKFVEFFGEGTASLTVTDRATIANMAPEYGATMGFFPIDDKTVDYLTKTGRTEAEIATFKAYYQAQNMYDVPMMGDIDYTKVLQMNLKEIVPSIAGPKRPQDRIALPEAQNAFDTLLTNTSSDGFNKSVDEASVRYTIAGTDTTLGHGDVVLAAITSCTNTSNPSVMLAAGLLAKKAVEKGLQVPAHIKTSLAPGSRVVADYLEKSGLQHYLDALGFNVVAFGCTTCIGNAGDLAPEINDTILNNDVIAAAVLSGNRNFEARIHPNIKANFLASPPLVVAFALAGRMNIDLTTEPISIGSNGQPVYLKDIWPNSDEISTALPFAFDPATFKERYTDFAKDLDLWQQVPAPTGQVYSWPESTYIAKPPFFDRFKMSTDDISGITGAKALLILGDSVTTDHISPAGSFKATTPAGQWLESKGVSAKDFNSYGSRRGHHDVMVRGTFANVRVKNLMLPANEDGSRIEGGYTLLNGTQTTVFDAAAQHMSTGTPTIVFGGEEYGTGSSRDWAAKGTQLLGVKAVIAKSFERIHRSNLVGMGVLPLQFKEGDSAEILGITGNETFDILGVNNHIKPQEDLTLVIHRPNGTSAHVQVTSRIDTPIEVDYYRHGGILPYVLRLLLGPDAQVTPEQSVPNFSHLSTTTHKEKSSMSSNNTHKQGQWAKWTGAAVAALLVALLFRGCNDWGQTVQAPKIDPAVVNKIDAPAVPVANKLMQLAGFNNNGKFTLNGTVPTDAIKAQIDAELKKTFGDGNYVNNLAVAADVKPAGWLAKLAGLFDFFKVSGAEVTFNGDAVTLSGTTGSLSEKLQTFLGDSIKVSALDIANASKAATGNALDTLNALKPDASGKEILDALNLQIINFASGSAVIPAENQAVLKKAATLLKDKKDFTFEIGGHADNVGNEAANLTLSEKRAAAVRDFLVKNGVADTMLTAKGYGSSIPVADNATEAGRFKNRRIEYR